MTALLKFLVLLANFLLEGHADACLSLSQVAGNQVQTKHMIWFKETIKSIYETVYDLNYH
jgi:hypothetical protein